MSRPVDVSESAPNNNPGNDPGNDPANAPAVTRDVMDLNFSAEELERYSRQILLPQIGASGQAKLRRSRVLVIGAGGLGAPLLQLLAGGGIGTLGIVDPDIVSLSNLQRQTLYAQQDIGRPKVVAAAERLHQINPNVEIKTWECRADETLLGALAPDWPLICDGTDNAETRLAVSDACLRHGNTLISGAAQGFSGQLVVFRPGDDAPCYRCLYPEVAEAPVTGCAFAGVVGATTAVMAGFMALEIFRDLVVWSEKTPETKLMLWDALEGSLRHFPVSRSRECTAPHRTRPATKETP